MTNASPKYTVTNDESYAWLEKKGVVNSSFYDINGVDLTAPYALQKRPFLVKRKGKIIGIHFSSEVAEEHKSFCVAEENAAGMLQIY